MKEQQPAGGFQDSNLYRFRGFNQAKYHLPTASFIMF